MVAALKPVHFVAATVGVALPDVEAVTSYGFDLAAELLAAQKEFVVSLAGTFTPAKTDES